MSEPTYPQTPPPWPVNPPRPPQPYQWLAAGIAGIAGGFIVVTLVSGQLAYLLSGRSGLPAEQGLLAVVQVGFGLLVVVAAYLLAPGPLPMRLIGAAVFVVGTLLTMLLVTLRLTGTLRGGPAMLYLLNPTALILLLGALGWLVAAGARTLAYVTLLPTIVVFVLVGLLRVAGLPSALTTTITLGLSLVIAVIVLIATKPARL